MQVEYALPREELISSIEKLKMLKLMIEEEIKMLEDELKQNSH